MTVMTERMSDGAIINLTHSGPVSSRPQVGMTYSQWLEAEAVSNEERAARKAARQTRVAARLLAEEANRQSTKKAHNSWMGVKVGKGGTKK
jgi:hypothetical protein